MNRITAHRPQPALPAPFFDLDRSAWTILDRRVPAHVTVVEPLPALPVWLN